MWPHSNDLTSLLNLDAYMRSCVYSWLLSLFLAHSWSLHPLGQWQSLCALCVFSRHGGQSQTVSSGEMVYYRGRHTQGKLQRSWGLQTHTWRFPRELALHQSSLSFAWLRRSKRLLPKAVAISPSYKHRLHRKLYRRISGMFFRLRLFNHTCWRRGYLCTRSGHRQQCVQSQRKGCFTDSCFVVRFFCMMFLSGGLRKLISYNLRARAANSFQQGFWHQSLKKNQRQWYTQVNKRKTGCL